MNDIDKLMVILPHWIEHNIGHGLEFGKWADLLREGGRDDLAALLLKAKAHLMDADSALKEALENAGGSIENDGQTHHHHHHNLPE